MTAFWFGFLFGQNIGRPPGSRWFDRGPLWERQVIR